MSKRKANATSTEHVRGKLTGRQMAVMNFILAYVKRHASAPTRREICEEFGFASPNAAQCHLVALERKGWILLRGDTNLSRNVVPL